MRKTKIIQLFDGVVITLMLSLGIQGLNFVSAQSEEKSPLKKYLSSSDFSKSEKNIIKNAVKTYKRFVLKLKEVSILKHDIHKLKKNPRSSDQQANQNAELEMKKRKLERLEKKRKKFFKIYSATMKKAAKKTRLNLKEIKEVFLKGTEPIELPDFQQTENLKYYRDKFEAMVRRISKRIRKLNMKNCKNHLKQLGRYLKLWKLSKGSYPPLDGGDVASNWGQYLFKKGYDFEKTILQCPLRGKGKKTPYVFANPKRTKYFPEGTIASAKPRIPIAGDDLSNHWMGAPVHMLLKNGTVRKVKPGDELYQKAYGPDGALNDKTEKKREEK